ncbi:MAG: AMP-binding protein, partial [Polyangiaceae bacterium]
MELPETANLADYFLFDRLKEGLGGKTALAYGDRGYSYDLVAQRTRAMTSLLARVGVRRGERVLIVLPDSPPFAWVFFGVLARGAVVAMGNPDSSPEQIDYLVAYTRATAVVTIPRVAASLFRSGHASPELVHVWVVPDTATGDDPEAKADAPDRDLCSELSRDLASVGAEARTFPLHRDEPAIWLFTSGSTGEPKANVHS